jgi:hypothetical protein
MTKVKTEDLSSIQLDWAVALATGLRIEFNHQYTEDTLFDGCWQCGPNHWQPLNKYSTDWAKGGPIIDKMQGLLLKIWLEGKPEDRVEAHINDYDGNSVAFGPTPLIAAMRAYVSKKLGEEVEIPEELCVK